MSLRLFFPFLFVMSCLGGCTSGLWHTAGEAKLDFDRITEIVSASRQGDQLTLVCKGVLARDKTPGEFAIIVPLNELNDAAFHDGAREDNNPGVIDAGDQLLELTRAHLQSNQTARAGTPITILPADQTGGRSADLDVPLPSGTTEAVGLNTDRDPPAVIYVTDHAIWRKRNRVYFTLEPKKSYPNTALYLLTPATLVADLVMAPVYWVVAICLADSMSRFSHSIGTASTSASQPTDGITH